jgi:hypothetical protein
MQEHLNFHAQMHAVRRDQMRGVHGISVALLVVRLRHISCKGVVTQDHQLSLQQLVLLQAQGDARL